MADIQLNAGFKVVTDQLGPLIAKYSKPITAPVIIKAENVKSLDALLSKLQNGNFGNAGGGAFAGATRSANQYHKALTSINREQAAMRSQSVDMNRVSGLERYMDRYAKNLERYPALLRKMQGIVSGFYDGQYTGRRGALAQDIAAVRTEALQAGVEVETLGQKMGKLFGEHWNTAVVMLGINALRRVSKELINNVKEIDSALTQFQIVSRASDSELSSFADSSLKSAAKISASFTDVVDAATVYKRLGFSTDDSLKYAELTTMYGRIGDVEIGDAEEAITAIVKAFNLDAAGLQTALDQMVTVGNNFPISAAQLGRQTCLAA